ncbi:MAG: hypothetical protein EOO88_37315 [Pedobacter sp.]|nr:MAG: hypothetical protein EOO88_37315 [Pedobacter sp.]
MQRLEAMYGPLPTDPGEQNSLWYKLYRGNNAEVSVIKSHKDFLLARDMASITFLYIFITALPMLFFGNSPYNYYYFIALIIEYVFIVIVAQNHGKRFVTNVLAVESAK